MTHKDEEELAEIATNIQTKYENDIKYVRKFVNLVREH